MKSVSKKFYKYYSSDNAKSMYHLFSDSMKKALTLIQVKELWTASGQKSFGEIHEMNYLSKLESNFIYMIKSQDQESSLIFALDDLGKINALILSNEEF